jgi:hypothetical protein
MGKYMERSELKILMGKNLRFLRTNTMIETEDKKTILNQTELGKFLGITEQQLGRFELAKNELSAVQTYKLSRFFGIEIEELFNPLLSETKYEKIITKIYR